MRDELREAARIAVRSPVLLGTLAALACAQGAACIAPVGVAVALLGVAVRAAADAPGGRVLGPGAAMAALLALPGLGALAGAVISEAGAPLGAPSASLLGAHGLVGRALAVLGALGVGLALAPLAAVPARLAQGRGLGLALGEAAGTTRPEALFGLLAAAPAALGAGLDAGPVASVVLATPPVCLALSRGALAAARAESSETMPRSSWLGPLAALAALALAALVALALPAPAHRRLVAVPPSGCRPLLEETGRHGLSVRPAGDAFVVRVWDGGGAGAVQARSWLGARLAPHVVCPVEGGFLLRFGEPAREVHALVDAAGVRRDDGLGARLRGRAVLAPLAALLAAAIVLVARRVRRRPPSALLAGLVAGAAALEILLRL